MNGFPLYLSDHPSNMRQSDFTFSSMFVTDAKMPMKTSSKALLASVSDDGRENCGMFLLKKLIKLSFSTV